MLYGLLVFLFILTCILLVVVILMQASKGGGLASSFGGMGGAGSILGARGATSVLQKATIGLAIFYGLLCLVISIISTSGGEVPESKTQERIRSEQPATTPLSPPPGFNETTTPAQPQPTQPAPGNERQDQPENNGSENQ